MPDREHETLNLMKDLIHKPNHFTAEEQARMERTLVLFQKEYDACKAIFQDRNAIYKNTFEALGLIGTIVTLIGDCHRLRNMILKESDHGRKYSEQIEDKLRDVVNQALISLMMLHQDNYEGR